MAEKLYLELKNLEEEEGKQGSFEHRLLQFAGLLSHDSLYYLHAVITKTLRLYPVVPQVRRFMAKIAKERKISKNDRMC